MAERPTPINSGEDMMSRSAVEQLLKTVLEEARKPYKDPEAEARKARDRERLRKQRAEAEESEKQLQDACPHLREDNTSAIAWAMQSDGVTRGVCMHCNRLIVPTDDDYLVLLKIPVRIGRYI